MNRKSGHRKLAKERRETGEKLMIQRGGLPSRVASTPLAPVQVLRDRCYGVGSLSPAIIHMERALATKTPDPFPAASGRESLPIPQIFRSRPKFRPPPADKDRDVCSNFDG